MTKFAVTMTVTVNNLKGSLTRDKDFIVEADTEHDATIQALAIAEDRESEFYLAGFAQEVIAEAQEGLSIEESVEAFTDMNVKLTRMAS